MIKDFGRLGWYVERAKQQKARKDSIHTKHLLVFRNDALPSINGVRPELVMVNSHNRTAGYRFMAGLFRFVCINGVIVSSHLFESLYIRHIGYSFKNIEALSKEMLKNVPRLVEQISKLESVKLNEKWQREFALRAVAARFPEYVDEQTGKLNIKAVQEAVDIQELLKPRRPEDIGDSVWLVFNRLQDQIIKGGWQRVGTKDGRSKEVRPVKNIGLDIRINQALWSMAEQYAEKVR